MKFIAEVSFNATSEADAKSKLMDLDGCVILDGPAEDLDALEVEDEDDEDDEDEILEDEEEDEVI